MLHIILISYTTASAFHQSWYIPPARQPRSAYYSSNFVRTMTRTVRIQTRLPNKLHHSFPSTTSYYYPNKTRHKQFSVKEMEIKIVRDERKKFFFLRPVCLFTSVYYYWSILIFGSARSGPVLVRSDPIRYTINLNLF